MYNIFKKFIVVGLLLLILAIVMTIYVWLKVQNMQVKDVYIEYTEKQISQLSDKSSNFKIPEEGIYLNANRFTQEQIKLATKVGIDLDKIVITPLMIECFEEKLGTEKLRNIVKGETPSVQESITLLTCL